MRTDMTKLIVAFRNSANAPTEGKVVCVHTIKAHWRSKSIPPLILSCAVDGGEWSTSCPARFSLSKIPGTH